jgi:hypothetical protein
LNKANEEANAFAFCFVSLLTKQKGSNPVRFPVCCGFAADLLSMGAKWAGGDPTTTTTT